MKADNTMIQLRYGNTNTFYIPGRTGGLLVDTDYAGTLTGFFKAIKQAGISIKDITYVFATHYHPDHCGLVGQLRSLGVGLLIADVQLPFVHFADGIFEKDGINDYVAVNEQAADIIALSESREFLKGLGIKGELIHTPSHSEDSVSLILDDGCCFVGDTEPYEYLSAYEDNTALKNDWERILSYDPSHICYAHANDKIIKGEKP